MTGPDGHVYYASDPTRGASFVTQRDALSQYLAAHPELEAGSTASRPAPASVPIVDPMDNTTKINAHAVIVDAHDLLTSADPLFPNWGIPYTVAPDGQRFLVNAAMEESRSSPITIITNWTAGLKR